MSGDDVTPTRGMGDMSKQTPMEDLLNQTVDEPELSPDNPETPHQDEIFDADGKEAFVQDEALPTPEEPPPEEANQNEQKQPDQEDRAESEVDNKSQSKPKSETLKPWQHARINAAQERAAKAETQYQAVRQQTEDLQRQLDEALNANKQWQTYYNGGDQGQMPQNHQQQQPDPRQAFDEQLFKVKSDLGYARAVDKHGQELPTQATHWARDVMQTDPRFAQAVMQASDPVEFSINAFRKTQIDQELAQYGYDIEALVQARMASQQPAPSPGETNQASSPQPPAQQQPQRNMPNDFTAAPSSGQRSTGAAQGITPLGELLELGSKRK